MTSPRSSEIRPTYDVVVVGLGIMGAATLFHLAQRDVTVLGVEAFGPLHSMGSSHGQTRIFRRAYWEGERYVPLLDRSYSGWRELEEAAAETIALRTGGLFIGDAGSSLVRGSLNTALRCGIDHEYLGASEISRRFPAFHVRDHEVAVYEPEAMMLFADRARLSYLTRAVAGGARTVHGQPVSFVRPETSGTIAVGGAGWQVSCASVVLTVGGWVGSFLPRDVADWLAPMRIPVFELDVLQSHERDHQPGRFPVFIHEGSDGALVYGLPQWQAGIGGVRLGFHNRQLSPIEPDGERPAPTAQEQRELWGAVRHLLPGVQQTGRGASCIYTMTSDESFLIGRSREIEGVHYASACSGHGFKFAPGIGEALAQLAVDGRSSLDLSAFSSDRARRPR